MRKRGFTKFIAVFLAICLIAPLVSFPLISVSAAESTGTGTGTNYYVDASGGNDANAGTSEAAAFKTLARVNEVNLEPGDSILLKRGEVWHGEVLQLTREDSGEEGNIVTVSSYGEGSKPLISADGAYHAIFIYNVSYILVENIEITNFVPEGQEPPVRTPSHEMHTRKEYGNGRSGIEILNDTGLIAKNIHIKNIDAHDIMGSNDSNNYWFQGAIFFMGADNTTSSFDDILIEGCHLWDNKCLDITSGIDYNTRPYTNVVVRNNVSERNGKGSIVLAGCYKPLIERNASYDVGLGWTNFGWVVPIWEYNCEDALFQYNESARCNANPSAPYGQNDAQGYDIDISTKGRATFQYNYSHDNAGGFMLVMPANEYMPDFEGFTIRYNLSVNDGRDNLGFQTMRILHSGTVGSYFYNNVIYDADGEGIVWAEVGDGKYADGSTYATGDILIQNNIFYSNSDLSDYQDGNGKLVFNNNLYYGSVKEAVIYSSDEASPLIADPLFAGPIPEVALDGMEAARVFKLSETSPCIDAGVVIDDNGGRDFFGNALYAGVPDIGIHEYGSVRLEEPVYGYDSVTFNDIDPLTYNGIYAVKATDVGSGSFYRTANVNTYTDYAASIYNRGTGTYGVTVKNAANNAVLASKTFTASGHYALRELSFNSRGATSIVFEVSGVSASGTAYFDAAFLGATGGANLLPDPDFEEEQGTWIYGTGFSHHKGNNIVICVESEPWEPAPPPEPTPPPVLPETADEINAEFNSTLGSQWRWINEKPDNWNMTDSSLHMDGLAGDVDNSNGSNILLQYAPEGDFTIETKMTGLPSAGWEQAGILLFVDEDNFIKLNRVNKGGEETNLNFQFGYKYDGTWPAKEKTTEDPSFSGGTATETCYLKLVKAGASYSGYYSFNGTDWTLINTFDNVYLKSKGYKQIGLYCLNGTGIKVDFDYFRISDMDLTAEEPAVDAPEISYEAYSGTWGLSVTQPNNTWKGFEAPSETGSLTLRYMIKGSGTINSALTQNWSSYQNAAFEATDEWREVSHEFSVVSGSAINFGFSNKVQGKDALILVDDIFLGTEGGINLLTGDESVYDFEDGGAKWINDGSLVFDASASSGGETVLRPKDGIRALQLNAKTSWSDSTAKPVLNAIDDYITISFDIAGTGNFTTSFASGDWGVFDDHTFAAAGDWSHVEYIFAKAVGSGINGVNFVNGISTGANILIDNVFIGVKGGINLLTDDHTLFGFENGMSGWKFGGAIYDDPELPPELYNINNKMYVVGDKVIFSVKTPNKAGKSIGYSFTGDLPEGAGFNPANRAFTWTPQAAGEYTLTFAVNEIGKGTVSEKSVTIYAVEPQEEESGEEVMPPPTTEPTVTPAPTSEPEVPKTVVTAEDLEKAIADRKDYSVDVKDDAGKVKYSWTFTKENLGRADADKLEDIKLGLTVSRIGDNKEINDLLTRKNKKQAGLVISFEHEGTLPVQASVRIYAGDMGIEKNTTVYLYYYNPKTKKLDILPYSSKGYKVDREGYITINIVHCSDYVALEKPADASIITSLYKQISFSPAKLELYTGSNKYSKSSLKITLPSTLRLVKKLKDTTAAPAVGGVTVTYKSSNTKVATVSSTGAVTAKGKGAAKVTMTVKLYYGKTVNFTTSVVVKEPSLKITRSVATMKVGDTFTFGATVSGYDKSSILWKSTVRDVVVINKATGKAVAKTKGTDYVEAVVNGKTVRVKVVVK